MILDRSDLTKEAYQRELQTESKELPEDQQAVANLKSELAEKEDAIRVLEAQIAAKQAEIDKITGTLGWRLLCRYGHIKHRFLLPVYGLFSRVLTKTNQSSQSPQALPLISLPVSSAGYDVICLPIADWDAPLFQRSQQLLSQFARAGHRCLHLRTSFHRRGPSVIAKRMAENIYSLELPGPAFVSLGRGQINKRMLQQMMSAIDALRSSAGIRKAVCIVELPFWAPLAVAMREQWGWKIIYDCMDDYRAFSTTGPAMLRQEDDLIAASCLTVATSRSLYERLSHVARCSLLLPNAADFEHFTKPGPLRPLDYLPHPIIGYYGAISDWFDAAMVRGAAAVRPDWHFVLIGDSTGGDVSSLSRLRNVHLLGPQPYAALPSYLHQFDVALIPFLRTALTEAVDPVKFYEYLSAGKPVVATALPELEACQDYFYPVRSREDFVPQIEAALKEQSSELIRTRIEFARHNTWRDRYKTLAEAINELGVL